MMIKWLLIVTLPMGMSNGTPRQSYTVDNIVSKQECVRLGNEIRRGSRELVSFRCLQVTKIN